MERKRWVGPKPAVHARLMLPLAPKSAAAILQAQQAALDRRLAQVERTRRKAHLVVERARAVSSSKLGFKPAPPPALDQRWLRAKWRQCQRLACIVARNRRHYRDVLGRVCRVKSARLLQRVFRTSWRRPALSSALMDFFALFPGSGDFGEVRQYCVDPRVLESAKQMTNNDEAKAKVSVSPVDECG